MLTLLSSREGEEKECMSFKVIIMLSKTESGVILYRKGRMIRCEHSKQLDLQIFDTRWSYFLFFEAKPSIETFYRAV